MKLLVVCYIIISLGLRDSIYHCVGPSVCQSVCWWVGRSVSDLLFQHFWRYASGFCITAPVQPQATAALLYMAPPIAPALHITASAQHPRLCQFVYPAMYE